MLIEFQEKEYKEMLSMDRHLYLCIGAKIIVTKSLEKSIGLNNGTVGTVKKIFTDSVIIGVKNEVFGYKEF